MLQALRNKDPIGVPNGWPAIVAAAYALLANQTKLLMCAEVDSKFVSRGMSSTAFSGSSMLRQKRQTALHRRGRGVVRCCVSSGMLCVSVSSSGMLTCG